MTDVLWELAACQPGSGWEFAVGPVVCAVIRFRVRGSVPRCFLGPVAALGCKPFLPEASWSRGQEP